MDQFRRTTELCDVCCLTPQSHEYGEENGGRVVEQVAGPSRSTGRAELPVAAHSVAQGAHGDVVSWVADLHAAKQDTPVSARVQIQFVCIIHCLAR